MIGTEADCESPDQCKDSPAIGTLLKQPECGRYPQEHPAKRQEAKHKSEKTQQEGAGNAGGPKPQSYQDALDDRCSYETADHAPHGQARDFQQAMTMGAAEVSCHPFEPICNCVAVPIEEKAD